MFSGNFKRFRFSIKNCPFTAISEHIILFSRQKSPFSNRLPVHDNRVTGQNGTGQNGTDKMVRTKWYTDKMVWDKMVWTKWYGQNGTDKMVVIFGIDYNSSEFNSYLVTKSHSEMINIQRKPK